jgi:hypothetical protein
MTRLVGLWLTLLIFLSGSALEGKVRFGDFAIAAESGGLRVATGMGQNSAEAALVRTIGRGEKVADIVAEAKVLTF